MNKPMVALAAAAIMLTACNSNGADEKSNEVIGKSGQSMLTTDKEKENEPQEEGQNQPKESERQGEWASLPEYDEIMGHVDHQNYTFQTVTDDEGKRILLLIDENNEIQYKTIFIKNDSRLKIVKMNGGGQIFNGVI
ncbi:hypothetical protein QYG89_15285 [Bacillus sp. B190/17]|uniref:Lipoprotein n=1 Tax=Bacillus lumedeiriae TaxID=3058829 RepID=A0ABW8ICW2_9BACI